MGYRMGKYIIDTDTGSCTPYVEDGASAPSISKKERMVRMLAEHRGDVEYSGFVATIQKWFYGSVVKASWCATTISYLLAQVGLGEIKAENVKTLLDKISASGKFELLDKTCDVERGDILFWLWSGNVMTVSSSKHVGIAEHPSTGNTIYCLGGNQKDKICTLAYDRKYLFCIARLKEV